jgi:hypothetical protein
VLDDPAECRSQVGSFRLQTIEPGDLIGAAQERLGPNGQIQVVGGVAGAHGGLLTLVPEARLPVLADRLQQPVAPLLADPLGDDERFVDQQPQQFEG